jgi:ABC-type uncharacterized transport system permease subunit
VRLPAFLTFRMTFGQYLVFQSVGSTFVNGALTALSALPARNRDLVPFGGPDGIARDTYLASLLLSGLTVIIGSLFVGLDVRTGRVAPYILAPLRHGWFRWLAHHLVPRSLVSAVFFTVLCAPPTLFVLARAGVDAMSFHDFLVFKVVYAMLLGMLVTPFNAAAVLVRKGDTLPRDPASAETRSSATS